MKIQKLYPFILICFSLLFPAYGQQNKSISTIRNYNIYINHAEIAITDSAYKKASCFYDTAFRMIEHPFAKDIYNAAVCDALLNNFKKCNTKILILLKKGLEVNVITENTAFSPFLNSRVGSKIFKKPVIPEYNIKLHSIYDSLLRADQYFRIKKPGDYMEFYGDTVCAIDASNVKYMNQLIQKYGWPTEELIGIMSLPQQPYDLIIIHQGTGAPCRIYDYSENVRTAYENCQISVQRAAYLIFRASSEPDDLGEMCSGIITVVYDPTGKFSKENLGSFIHKTGFYSISDNSMKKINDNRSEFGLELIADMQRKLLFNTKDYRFRFSSYGGNSIFTVEAREDYENQIKNLVSF